MIATVELLARGNVSAPIVVTHAIPARAGRGRARQPWIADLGRSTHRPRPARRPASDRDRAAARRIARAVAASRHVPEHAARGHRSRRLVQEAGARRQRRDQPGHARSGPARAGRSRPERHRLRTPRSRRGPQGSAMGRHAGVRPPAAAARRCRERMALWRHRPHGIRARRPSATGCSIASRSRPTMKVPQRAGARADRCRRAGRLVHRRDDAAGRGCVADAARAANGAGGTELRHRRIRPAAGAADAQGPTRHAIVRASWCWRISPATISSTRKRSTSSRDRAGRSAAPCRVADQGCRQPRGYVVSGQRAARHRHLAVEAGTCRGARPTREAPATRPTSRRTPTRRRTVSSFDRGMFTAAVERPRRCGGRSCRRISTR